MFKDSGQYPSVNGFETSRRRTSKRRRTVTGLTLAGALALSVTACIVNGAWTATAPIQPASGTGTFQTVACVSTDWCVAGGNNGTTALVQVWDGSAWTARTPPAAGANGRASIDDLDCFAADRCMALVNRGSTGYRYMTWNGSMWTAIPGTAYTPVPPNFTSISCGTNGCVFFDADNTRTVTWNGTSFASTPFDESPGGYNIDCVTTADCVAVGKFSEVSHWNGTGWTNIAAPSPILFEDVSCSQTTTDCVAIGPDGNNTGRQAAARWDGAVWSQVTLPAGPTTDLTGVSCVASGECFTVGVSRPSELGDANMQLSIVGADGYVAPGSPHGNVARYRAVSCLPQSCLVVGDTPSTSPILASLYEWTYP